MLSLAIFALTIYGCKNTSFDTEFQQRTWEQLWLDGCDAIADLRLNDARRAFQDAEQQARLLGAADPRLGFTLRRLGDAYALSDMLEDAESAYQRAVEVLRANLSRHSDELVDKELVDSLTSLGELQLRKRKFKEAEATFNQAIREAEHIGGSNMERNDDRLLEISFASALKGLGLVYSYTNRSMEAEAAYSRALRFDVAGSISVNAESGPEAFVKAVDKLRVARAAMTIEEEKRASEIISNWTPVQDAGVRAGSEHNYALAEENFSKAFEIGRQIRLTAPQAMDSLTELLKVLIKQRKYSRAEQLSSACLSKIISDTNPPNKQTDNALGEMAKSYLVQDKFRQAIPYVECRLKLRQKLRGPNNFHVAETLYDLGVLYQKVGAFPEAELVFNKALQILKDNNMLAHELAQDIKNHLAVKPAKGLPTEHSGNR